MTTEHNPYGAPHAAPLPPRPLTGKLKDARSGHRLLLCAFALFAFSVCMLVLEGMFLPSVNGVLFAVPVILMVVAYLGMTFSAAIVADALWGMGPMVWGSLVFGLIPIVAPATALFGWLRLRRERD